MRTTRFAIAIAICALTSACLDTEESIENETYESHSWAGYHWARTSDNFQLRTINSLTPDWSGYLNTAAGDWNSSGRLDFALEAGDTSRKTRRRCSGDAGTIRVCNLAYGQTGWLGIAGINADSNGHITSGYTKLNDTYFAMAYYDNADWRQSVTCQEIGHNVGLDHQDEDFNNVSLKSCMDYQDPPWPSPNNHDYDMLDTIYTHLDSYDSYDTGSSGGGGGGGGSGCNAPPGKGCNKGTANGWGTSQGRHGNHETFVRRTANGGYVITKVTWAEGH
jgi:hypothetical protein